jgi:rod shape-determining protein MreC
MESVLGRYRNLTILVGVLFLQVLGLAVQVKRENNIQSTRLIRIWAIGAVAPFERSLVWVQTGSNNLWHNFIYLRGVRAENRGLKEQIEQLRLQQVRLTEDAEQAHRLQALLAFKEQFLSKTVAAQVIGSGGSDLSRSIYIDKGSDAGVKTDMAVITANGIVGKVLLVYPSVSEVLVINDQTSGVGAILEKSRLQGVLKGTSTGGVMLERVMNDEQVADGDMVLTSGGDGIFPKGLPVGTVTRVEPGKELFLNITVRPAASLSRLEEVLVVTQKEERQVMAAGSGRVRAVDIMAQRLPSVPDKPPADAHAVAEPSGAGTKPEGANPETSVKPNTKTQPAANEVKSPDAEPSGGVTTPKPAHAGKSPSSATKLPALKPADSSKPVAPKSTPPAQSKAQAPAAQDDAH